MGSLTLNGATSGQITLNPPAVAGTNTLSLPAATGTLIYGTQPSGTIVGTTDTQTLTNKTLTSPAINTPTITSPTITSPTISGTPVMSASVITSGTTQASTSGTSIDFTGIPSWVKRVTILLSGVSTSGGSNLLIQVGAGSIATSGYNSTGAYTNSAGGAGLVSSTAGLVIYSDNPTFTRSGTITICLLGSNSWTSSHSLKVSTGQTAYGGGDVALSGALDRVRITTVNGTDTFDAGSINILYE